MPSYAFAYFLPIILEGMGYSAARAQILSAPPYIVACVIGFSLAVVADRVRMRSPIIALQACMCIVGLSITAYATDNGARYFGVFVGLAGAQGNIPAVLSYQSNNIRMNSKRGVGSALQVGFGAIGGIMASTVFRSQDSPRYINGIWATIGCQFLILTLLVVMTAYFRVKNKQHKEGTLKESLEGHPKFTYTY
jgi:MFS family permease